MATALATSASLTTTTSRQTGQGADPIARVQVSFDADLTQPPVWTDITNFVRSVDYQTGRNFELDQFEAGTMTVVLSTNDGRFSPENTSGIYYQYLTPLRRVRLIAEYEGVVYPLWAGFVETWEPTTNAGGADLITTMRATDAFKAARYADVNQTFYAESPGERIRALLGGTTAYDVVTNGDGSVTCQAVTLTNTDPVGAAQTAAANEQGFLYCDQQGRIRFDDRNYRVVNESNTRIVFGTGTGEKPYRDAVYSYNDERLYTEVRVKADGSTEQIAPASGTSTQITEFGRRTLALTLPVQVSPEDDTPDDEWAASLANYLLNRYNSPGIRLDELIVSPASDATLWSSVLAAPLGGRLLVKQRPAYLIASGAANLTSPTKVTGTSVTTGTGGTLERSVFIEKIAMSIKPATAEWTIRYGLSAADTSSYWVLGSPTQGVLGDTTRLGL